MVASDEKIKVTGQEKIHHTCEAPHHRELIEGEVKTGQKKKNILQLHSQMLVCILKGTKKKVPNKKKINKFVSEWYLFSDFFYLLFYF